jgi:hypothetical protein
MLALAPGNFGKGPGREKPCPAHHRNGTATRQPLQETSSMESVFGIGAVMLADIFM